MHLFQAEALLSEDLSGWTMAGEGGFDYVGAGVVESRGGPGLCWYGREIYENLVLEVEWRVASRTDNSGVFLRCPPLAADPAPAIERGFEVQIDERGYDPEARVEDSALHSTGAIYKLAPALAHASYPIGEWNRFHIVARGGTLEVALNGELVSRTRGASREPRGHVALQAHHEGSRVQFRALRVRRLEE